MALYVAIDHHQRGRLFFVCSISPILRWLSTGADSDSDPLPPEFDEVENAYEILGVCAGCSFEEIKAAFRRLAKETHPDVVEKEDDSSRFVRIVAAYEAVDPRKRAQYDRYLSSQKKVVRKTSEQGSSYHMYASYTTTTKQMEVVEWLRWYRYAVKEILAGKVVHGTRYFDEIERNFYAAIHAAYHGPEIEIFDLLPDRFEAEVRSVYDTPEVLHLVSRRDLFGMVRMVDNFLELSNIHHEKLSPSGSIGLHSSTFFGNEMWQNKFAGMEFNQLKLGGQKTMKYHEADAYKNLELHLFGKLVATATRAPPGSRAGDLDEKEAHDQVHVFLSSRNESSGGGFSKNTMSDNTRLDILVCTITGLGTNPEESSCYVYDRKGSKTHVILKHRTLLVMENQKVQFGQKISSMCPDSEP
ncbi:Chaperone protein DnaJ-like protein [Drosera capensis]